MPTVSIFALSDLSAPAFNDRMVDGASDSAFTPLQGNLDLDNLTYDPDKDTDTNKLKYQHLQRGEMVKVWTVAGTANLDYRLYWFEGQDSTAWNAGGGDTDPGAKAYDIPGGSKTIYVPESGYVMLDWNVFWTNDANRKEGRSWIMLRVDGSTVDSQRRFVGVTTKYSTGTSAVLTPGYGKHEGFAKNRFWAGHAFVFLSKGYHDISLCVTSGKDALNTRIWTRSLRAVWMAAP